MRSVGSLLTSGGIVVAAGIRPAAGRPNAAPPVARPRSLTRRGVLGGGARGSALGAEVGRVGGRARVAGAGIASLDGDADVLEARVEDVLPVRRRSHPAGDDPARGAVGAAA